MDDKIGMVKVVQCVVDGIFMTFHIFMFKFELIF